MNQNRLEIARRIKIIGNAFAGNKNRFLNEHKLTFAQVEIMLYLLHHPERVIYQKEIEQASRLTNPTVTGILNRLEEKGMISRRVDENDKRYRVVELSEKGKEILRNIGDDIHRTEENLFGCLSEEETKELLRLLDKVVENSFHEQKESCTRQKRGGTIC